MLAVGLMLDHIDLSVLSTRLGRAIDLVLRKNGVRTPSRWQGFDRRFYSGHHSPAGIVATPGP